MRTIIKLAIFTAFAVLPFMTMAQVSDSEEWERLLRKATTKDVTVYVPKDTTPSKEIVNPEWFKHLLGKTMEEITDKIGFECDTIKWMYEGRFSWTKTYTVYIVHQGSHIGEYTLYYEKGAGDPAYKGVLTKIVYEDKLSDWSKQLLSGTVRDESYYLRQAGIQRESSPSEKVWLKFWEQKFKDDIKKDLKNSK